LLLRETVDQTLVKISERGPDDTLHRAFENRLLYLNNSWPLLAKEMEGLMLRHDALGELVQVLNRQKAVNTQGVLYVGVVDLAAFHDGKWWLVDFKTSRPAPEEELEIFIQREVKGYAPQLRVYREMWAKAREVDESEIETVVYRTGLKQWLVVSD